MSIGYLIETIENAGFEKKVEPSSMPGIVPNNLYFNKSAIISREIINENGDLCITDVIFPGQLFGDFLIEEYASAPESEVMYRSIRKGRVSYMRDETIREIITNPDQVSSEINIKMMGKTAKEFYKDRFIKGLLEYFASRVRNAYNHPLCTPRVRKRQGNNGKLDARDQSIKKIIPIKKLVITYDMLVDRILKSTDESLHGDGYVKFPLNQLLISGISQVCREDVSRFESWNSGKHDGSEEENNGKLFLKNRYCRHTLGKNTNRMIEIRPDVLKKRI